METLGVSTNNKFSFNSRTKISVEKLVRYCYFSGMAAHLDNDHKERISLTVGSRKSKDIDLESKGSLELFPGTNSTIL